MRKEGERCTKLRESKLSFAWFHAGQLCTKMATEYLGSTISLISKSDIRYQGVLHSIDPVEATVSLEKGEFSSASLALCGTGSAD